MKKKITLQPFEENFQKLALEIELESQKDSFQISFSFPITHHVNKDLSKKHSQWGLWDYDVFEIFMQKRPDSTDSSLPYTEFQVSPLGQFFHLEILKKRELYFTPLTNPFHYQLTLDRQWKGIIKFPKEDNIDYFFNFTAILGPKNKRNYFASSGEYSKPADFHCPDLFQKFL